MYYSFFPNSVCTVLLVSPYLCINLSPYLCISCSCLPNSLCTVPVSIYLRVLLLSLSHYFLLVSQSLYVRVLSSDLCTYCSCLLIPQCPGVSHCNLFPCISYPFHFHLLFHNAPPASSHCPPLSPHTLSPAALSSDNRVSSCPFSSLKLLVHVSCFLFHFTSSWFVSSFLWPLPAPISFALCCSVCFLSYCLLCICLPKLSCLLSPPPGVSPPSLGPWHFLSLPLSFSLFLSVCSDIFCFKLFCLFLVLFVSSLFVSRSCLAFCLLLQVCLLLP